MNNDLSRSLKKFARLADLPNIKEIDEKLDKMDSVIPNTEKNELKSKEGLKRDK